MSKLLQQKAAAGLVETPSSPVAEPTVGPVGPAGPPLFPGFTPGPVDPVAASVAFGHYTEAAEPNMSEAPPPPGPQPKRPIVYDPRNSSYQPPEPSLGQKVKNTIGKVWSGVQGVLGPKPEEPVYGPPLLQGLNPDGTLADHMVDGSPLPDGPRAAGGSRG